MPNKIDQLLHDARGPLNTISINAEVASLLLQRSAPTDEVTVALSNILRECQRCNEILLQIGNANAAPSAEIAAHSGAV